MQGVRDRVDAVVMSSLRLRARARLRSSARQHDFSLEDRFQLSFMAPMVIDRQAILDSALARGERVADVDASWSKRPGQPHRRPPRGQIEAEAKGGGGRAPKSPRPSMGL
jgi:hypothetical protein